MNTLLKMFALIFLISCNNSKPAETELPNVSVSLANAGNSSTASSNDLVKDNELYVGHVGGMVRDSFVTFYLSNYDSIFQLSPLHRSKIPLEIRLFSGNNKTYKSTCTVLQYDFKGFKVYRLQLNNDPSAASRKVVRSEVHTKGDSIFSKLVTNGVFSLDPHHLAAFDLSQPQVLTPAGLKPAEKFNVDEQREDDNWHVLEYKVGDLYNFFFATLQNVVKANPDYQDARRLDEIAKIMQSK